MVKTKILIVDDHIENIRALSLLIEAPDIEILSAQNAQDALDLLVKNEFGLALLDVHMPNVSGIELARLIRGVNRFKNLPVIFVTAHQKDHSMIFEGYETGAVDLLFKPLDPHVVRTKVRVFVQLDQQSKLLKEQMRELEKLKKDADAANIAKSQFLANMSHEIRTPLAAVLGFTDVLCQNEVHDLDKKKFSEAIQRNGQLLLRIINDILDISKIEANKLLLEETKVDFDEILQDIQSTLMESAREKNIKLDFNIGKLPKDCVADPIRIKQILLNIIGNAVKFTNQGGIHVTASSQDISLPTEKTKRFNVVFEVLDTGIGLTEVQIKKIFHPFSQADSSTRRTHGGTGLGLVISKQLAQAMGGDVVLAHSEFGKGSKFVINLAVEQRAVKVLNTNKLVESYIHESMVDSNIRKNILVVDDSADNRTLVKLFLKTLGANFSFACNGKDAIDAVGKSEFDLIFMDIQMPEMDGCEATERIRELGLKVPIIALTAHAMEEEHSRYRQSGCNAVITKPINKNELISTSSKYLNLN